MNSALHRLLISLKNLFLRIMLMLKVEIGIKSDSDDKENKDMSED